MLCWMLMALTAARGHAAAPPTGTPINNRASLEYFLTASRTFVAIQSAAVRVIVGGTSPYLFTKSASPTARAVPVIHRFKDVFIAVRAAPRTPRVLTSAPPSSRS